MEFYPQQLNGLSSVPKDLLILFLLALTPFLFKKFFASKEPPIKIVRRPKDQFIAAIEADYRSNLALNNKLGKISLTFRDYIQEYSTIPATSWASVDFRQNLKPQEEAILRAIYDQQFGKLSSADEAYSLTIAYIKEAK
jgi:hypothetical protein